MSRTRTERLEHRLYVWRIADTTRWQDATSVELSDFTVHGMRCEHRSVQLAAWDAIHTVTWRQPEIETLELQITPKPAGPPDPTLFPDLAASLVFGREQRVFLPFGESYSFELRVGRARDESNPCCVLVRSTIARIANGVDVDQFEVFRGVVPAECGE